METLNTIMAAGKTTSHYLSKLIIYTSYINPIIDTIKVDNIILYMIFYMIFLVWTFYRIRNYTSHDFEYISDKIDSNDGETSWATKLIVSLYILSSIYSFILTINSDGYNYAILSNIFFTFAIYNYYKNISYRGKATRVIYDSFGKPNYVITNVDDITLQIIKYLFVAIYIISGGLLLTQLNVIPDTFHVGMIILSLPVFSLSIIGRDNISNFIYEDSYTIYIWIVLYIFIKNLIRPNISNSKIMMNLLFIGSMISIWGANYNIMYSPPSKFKLLYFSNPFSRDSDYSLNQESIGYMAGKSRLDDCKLHESDEKYCSENKDLNLNRWKYRRDKIMGENKKDSRLYNLYSFIGPYYKFIFYQVLIIMLSQAIISILLKNHYNPLYLYSKFFIYIFITNITIFYINNLIREYNLFKLRNVLYKQSDMCTLVTRDKNLNNTYNGPATDESTKSSQELCLTKKSDGATIHSWKNFYQYSDSINTVDKLSRINMNGIYISIFTIIYFSIVYSCDYISWYYEMPNFKHISIIILLLVIVAYVIIYNIDTQIDDYMEGGDIDKMNKLFKDPDNSDQKLIHKRIHNIYDIKELFNNILMITIIYTIIFYTHRFFDASIK